MGCRKQSLVYTDTSPVMPEAEVECQVGYCSRFTAGDQGAF